MQPDPLVASTQAFFRFGRQHAPFMAAMGVVVSGLVLLGYNGSRISRSICHWFEDPPEPPAAGYRRIETSKQLQGASLQAQVALLQAQPEKEAATNRAKFAAANARVAQARAEAIQETSDRFLGFGYVEECQKFQKKTFGDKTPKSG